MTYMKHTSLLDLRACRYRILSS